MLRAALPILLASAASVAARPIASVGGGVAVGEGAGGSSATLHGGCEFGSDLAAVEIGGHVMGAWKADKPSRSHLLFAPMITARVMPGRLIAEVGVGFGGDVSYVPERNYGFGTEPSRSDRRWARIVHLAFGARLAAWRALVAFDAIPLDEKAPHSLKWLGLVVQRAF